VHIDPYIVLGSAVVGLLVGVTGAGGGALMTPMLILLFGVKAPSAISSDLVAAVLMRPVGAVVHMRRGTVNYRLVGWLTLGSVPMALVGAYLLHLLGSASAAPAHVEQALGAALLTGAAAMVIRYVLDLRSGKDRQAALRDLVVKPLPTVVIGMIGGVIVGLTSVGSGSLMIVLLLFLYPVISAGRLVGTDLTQAVPLTLAAAAGALIFGSVQFGVTISIVIGSVPAVLAGSLLSSRAPDKVIRPVITFVIFASGLKYVGVGTAALGWICGLTLVAAALIWGTLRLRSAEDRPVPVHGHQRADGDHVGEDRRAAVGDERQRQPGNRHDADGHPDVDERLNGEPDRDARRDEHAELVVRADGDAHRARHDDREQDGDHQAADEPGLLAGHREDEVGVRLGHESASDELTVEQALARQAARPDRDL
jgi:uncharacterized membrane protein YfcA